MWQCSRSVELGHKDGSMHILSSIRAFPGGQKQPETHIAGHTVVVSSLFRHVNGHAEPQLLYCIPSGQEGSKYSYTINLLFIIIYALCSFVLMTVAARTKHKCTYTRSHRNA